MAYAPLLIWIGIIFFLSGSFGSFDETSRFIGPLLRFLFPDASPETLAQYHGVIRKLTHVGVYGVLGILTVRTLTLRYAPGAGRLVIISLLIVLIIASLDEMNQSYLSSRTGTSSDVLIDLLGGLLGMVLGMAFYAIRIRGDGRRLAEAVRE